MLDYQMIITNENSIISSNGCIAMAGKDVVSYNVSYSMKSEHGAQHLSFKGRPAVERRGSSVAPQAQFRRKNGTCVYIFVH